MYKYPYPHPALTVDAFILNYSQKKLSLLLIQRRDDPYKGAWAFPGGFVDENEPVENAMERELKEETGLEINPLHQIYVASETGRDPRGWTVSVVFLGFSKGNNINIKPGDDAKAAQWFPLDSLPKLAFDHSDITGKVIMKLKQVLHKEYLSSDVGALADPMQLLNALPA